MYIFNTNNTAVHFDFPEGQIDFNEVLQAVGQAGRLSLRNAMAIRVTIAGMEQAGTIEARHTLGRIYPPVVEVPTPVLYFPPTHGYEVYICPLESPFYRLCIPGVIDSIDPHIMAVCPDFNRWNIAMCELVFNLSQGMARLTPHRIEMPPAWRMFPEDYDNIRAYRDMLAKKPRIAKPVDFSPILIKLFGEKIAAAILKEIK